MPASSSLSSMISELLNLLARLLSRTIRRFLGLVALGARSAPDAPDAPSPLPSPSDRWPSDTTSPSRAARLRRPAPPAAVLVEERGLRVRFLRSPLWLSVVI